MRFPLIKCVYCKEEEKPAGGTIQTSDCDQLCTISEIPLQKRGEGFYGPKETGSRIQKVHPMDELKELYSSLNLRFGPSWVAA